MSHKVLWQKCSPGARSEVLRVHTVRPGERSVVIFLAEGDGIAETRVHWIEGQGKGFGYPCLGDDCPHCPASAYSRRYAPVLKWHAPLPSARSVWTPIPTLFDWSAARYEKAVLEITLSWFSITEKAAYGRMFELCRPSPHKQGRTHFNCLGDVTIPKGLAFDPRPVIERAWGIPERRES
jgi:hypothetical protein